MAQIPEMATESVNSVKFSFLTTEEVRKYSFKKITEVQLFDNLDRPVANGLYDPELGPALDNFHCISCGQRPMQCPGHCGHIELVSPIYNPLLFNILLNLLRKTCFSCHYFTDEREQVEKCAFQLKLIMKGDIVGASNIDVVLQSDYSSSDENGAARVKHASDHSQASDGGSKHLMWKNWTSLQYSHAMSLLEEFMKRRSKKCARCGFKGPKLTHPTFGWIYMKTSDTTIRRNVIRGSKLVDDAEQTSIIGGAQELNEVSARGIKADSDDMQSSGAVCDGTLDSSRQAIKGRVGNFPHEFLRHKKLFSGPLLPSEVKDHIKLLWDNETQLCSLICDIHQERLCISDKKRSYSMFFIEALLVPPIKFRPITRGGDSVTNHPQTVLLAKVLQSNIDLGYAHMHDRSKIVTRWLDLQQAVNLLFGNKKSIGQRDNVGTGICQLLEKKEGLFRQKMMGKRVNYSCRSVISPDPYLAVNEIGIPPCFALKLTYPERVTPWNLDKLRNAIINGPDVHPGATHFSDQPGPPTKLAANRKKRIAISRKLPSSRGVNMQPGKSVEHEEKVVYRHLQDGDIVLVNRQPTLHKPSIMAHVVRVLSGERTLRMHYANCSTYNADFDGDEMNVHFPQDEISRAEAFQIVNANNQYIIPTSGDTKRGLIQDHIVAAVLLTKKDTFLSREEYTHLLYSSGVSAAARVSFVGKSRRKVSTSISEDDIELMVPAILKPEPLWTGKQVITSLLNHMTNNEGLPPFTFEANCTISNQLLTSQSNYGDPPNAKTSDPPFQIHDNDFLDGVIDKAQFGKYGLIHTVQELYGSNTAGILLSGLSRLFTGFLQFHGFTCGVDDLLLKQKIDIKKREQLEDAEKIDDKAYCYITNTMDESKGQDSKMVAATPEKIERMKAGIEEKVRVHGDAAISLLDKMMSNAAVSIVNKVQKIIFPNETKDDKTKDWSTNKSEDNTKDIGLSKAFPRNCFFLMTTSGAKGSQANFSQVSSLLGQQSLEGKRVPLMISGKSLPCFPPWDPALRAGGFITDCFLTGLRPQEYYFHCMAGREGLVDTAVKTSRSGYLQRCLVKNLECLKVGYDRTVRDADGSIIQFLYGGDGVDVHKTSFISKFDTIAHNEKVVLKRLRGQCEDDQLTSPDNFIGEELPENLVDNVEGVMTSFAKKQQSSMKIVCKKNRKSLDKKKFMHLMMLKYHSSLAQPGEPVGVIAAQSVGEPSTQMTLNTFHHAGQSDANVTLGIPRLQEILMRASEKIQTPIMSCPLLGNKTMDDAKRLAEALRKVTVADIVESMEVSVVPFSVQNHEASTIYKLKMKLFSANKYPKDSGITPKACGDILKSLYVQELERAIQSHVSMLSKIAGIKNIVQKAESDILEETDEADPGQKLKKKGEDNGSDDDDEADDLDTDAQKRRQQNTDEMEYEDGIENQNIEGEPSGFESEIDQVEPENENGSDGEAQILDAEDESRLTPDSKSKSGIEKLKSEVKRNTADTVTKKETDRAIHLDFKKGKKSDKESYFEVHFKLTNEPHILLSQIAQRAAKNVYIKKLAKIDGCKAIHDTKNVDKPPEIRTSGVDFHALWEMQDDLDINQLDSNDIHAILQTYGVEAARTTIVKELGKVFGTYGISTNFRHLGLIADFMTHTGKYRPMSRLGMADSISPFSKMSFETASNFIVNAAYHGEVDNLESPSARICLGLPVKMGTGCFDLMQKCKF